MTDSPNGVALNPALGAGLQALERYLAMVSGDISGFLEVRWRSATGGMGQRFAPTAAHTSLVEPIIGLGRRTDVYVGCAPRALPRGTGDAVMQASVLWVDIDTPAAVAKLAMFDPSPTTVVLSGGITDGYAHRHAYWELLAPVSAADVVRFNRRLAFALDGDMRCADAARILRPPGTLNHKGGQAAPIECIRDVRLETQRVFLGTATPGDVPGNFHSSLAALGDRATYFYSASGKYWYDLQANISRRAKDQAERLHIEEVYKEVADRLAAEAKTRGSFAGVHVCPEDAADIPDVAEARLVILHPKLTHKRGISDSNAIAFARSATEHRGAANRTYRNMLVYLAGDRDRIDELEHAVREYLGWSEILDKEDDLNLTTSQRNQAAERKQKASETTDSRLTGAYQWALVPSGQPIEIQATKIEGQATSLAERVSRRLGNDGALAIQHAAPAIRHQLDTHAAKLWADGHVPVGVLWRLYAEYPYMPRLRDRGVLDEGLTGPQLLWEQEGFALADGYDETTSKYRALTLPGDGMPHSVIDSTLIVAPAQAMAQRAAETPQAPSPAGATKVTASGAGSDGGSVPGPQLPEPLSPGKTRYFGSKRLQADRYATDFKKLADEVLGPLGATAGVTLNVTIEIEATTAGGFDDAKIRTVSENAMTLKFEQSGFEEG